RFEALTAAGTQFETARLAAHEVVDRCAETLYLPDLSASPLVLPRREPVAQDDPNIPLTSRLEKIYPNYLAKVTRRWADPCWVRGHLRTALEDVREVLDLTITASDRMVLQRWQAELWAVAAQSDREHLFAAHLLRECGKATDPAIPGP